MAELTPQARANAAFSQVLGKMPHGSGNQLAEAMGLSAKDLSEIKNKMMEPSLLLLAHLGLKVVPTTYFCLDRVSYEYLTSLHQRVARKAPTLCWEDFEAAAEPTPGTPDA